MILPAHVRRRAKLAFASDQSHPFARRAKPPAPLTPAEGGKEGTHAASDARKPLSELVWRGLAGLELSAIAWPARALESARAFVVGRLERSFGNAKILAVGWTAGFPKIPKLFADWMARALKGLELFAAGRMVRAPKSPKLFAAGWMARFLRKQKP